MTVPAFANLRTVRCSIFSCGAYDGRFGGVGITRWECKSVRLEKGPRRPKSRRPRCRAASGRLAGPVRQLAEVDFPWLPDIYHGERAAPRAHGRHAAAARKTTWRDLILAGFPHGLQLGVSWEAKSEESVHVSSVREFCRHLGQRFANLKRGTSNEAVNDAYCCRTVARNFVRRRSSTATAPVAEHDIFCHWRWTRQRR